MWSTRTDQQDTYIRIEVDQDSTPLPYSETLQLWQDNPGFRTFFINLLKSCPYHAFRWETPPVRTATADRPFEFVLLDSPELDVESDASVFAEHFSNTESVVTFPNLGNDAILLAPCPSTLSAYSHIGSFVRQASDGQQHELWKHVGAAMQRRLSCKPVWLSTAGGGVAWLHVRLDDRPKYYGYAPYRKELT